MRYAIILILLLSITTMVSANEICEYVTIEQEVEEGKFLPSFLPYSNEVFVMYNNDEVIGHVIVEDKEITSVGCTETDSEATYTVEIKDLQTVKDVFESNNTIDVFDKKISNKDIDVKGATFTKSVKLFFTKIGLKIGSWFN